MIDHTALLEVKSIPMFKSTYDVYTLAAGKDIEHTDDVQFNEGYLVESSVLGDYIHPDHKQPITWMDKKRYDSVFFRDSYHTDEYEEMSVPELAVTLRDLKSDLEKVGAIKTRLQKSYDFLSVEVLPERMDEEDIQTLKIKDVGRLQVSSDLRCSVPAKNREAMEQWLVDNGHGSMISSTINSSTLKAFVKERIKEQKAWPEDLLTVLPYSRATVVKG